MFMQVSAAPGAFLLTYFLAVRIFARYGAGGSLRATCANESCCRISWLNTRLLFNHATALANVPVAVAWRRFRRRARHSWAAAHPASRRACACGGLCRSTAHSTSRACIQSAGTLHTCNLQQLLLYRTQARINACHLTSSALAFLQRRPHA